MIDNRTNHQIVEGCRLVEEQSEHDLGEVQIQQHHVVKSQAEHHAQQLKPDTVSTKLRVNSDHAQLPQLRALTRRATSCRHRCPCPQTRTCAWTCLQRTCLQFQVSLGLFEGQDKGSTVVLVKELPNEKLEELLLDTA